MKSAINFDFESAIVIKLTDYANSNNVIEMRIKNIDGDTYFVVNDNKTIVLNNDLNKESNSYMISFNGAEFYCESYHFSVEKMANGLPFEDFDSNLAYVTIGFENANSNTSVNINDLCQCP